MRNLTLSLTLSLSPVALIAAENPPVAPAIEAAILPGADFFARFDPAAVERSPLVRSLWGEAVSRLAARLESSGIAASDIAEVLVSARSDSVAPEGARRGERGDGLPAVIAVSLKTKIEPEKLTALLSGLWGGRRTASRSELEGAALIELQPASPGEPPLLAAAPASGTTVFLSTHRESLEGALARERSGRHEKLAEELARVNASLPSGLEARTILLPAQLWERFSATREKASEQRPPTMSERALLPFRGLRSLALTLDLAEEARIGIIGEHADQAAAKNLEVLLTSLFLPNLERMLSERLGTALRLEDSLEVDSEGSTTRLTLRLGAEDLMPLTERH
jgi:hypothetical protein